MSTLLSLTGADLIRTALRKTGTLSKDEDPTPGEIQDALQALNFTITSLQSEGAYLWATEQYEFNLSPGIEQYVLPTDTLWVSDLRILWSETNIEYPVELVDRKRWAQLWDKQRHLAMRPGWALFNITPATVDGSTIYPAAVSASTVVTVPIALPAVADQTIEIHISNVPAIFRTTAQLVAGQTWAYDAVKSLAYGYPVLVYAGAATFPVPVFTSIVFSTGVPSGAHVTIKTSAGADLVTTTVTGAVVSSPVTGPTLFFYRTPNDISPNYYKAVCWRTRALDVASVNATPDVQSRWLEALVYGTAARLADELVLPIERCNLLQSKAEHYLKIARGGSSESYSQPFIRSIY